MRQIKCLFVTIFFFVSIISNCQDFSFLEEPGAFDKIPKGKSIIYGNFIQRLGYSSGGYPQDINLMNVEAKEVVTIRVKQTLSSAKENIFCYIIKPGTYEILNYCWTDSKWYGGRMFTEPIYKGINAMDSLEIRFNSGQIKKEELMRFKFTIVENSICYLGSWHFETGLVSFSDDKIKIDKIVNKDYKKLNFSAAITILPY